MDTLLSSGPSLASLIWLINERVHDVIQEQVDRHGLIWLTIGFLGQGMFFLRFAWQWLVSERAGQSRIPIVFWYLSLAGSVLVCLYAAFKASGLDPVLLLAGPLQIVIYIRNIMLLRKTGQSSSDVGDHCTACEATLVLRARFCHACGHAVGTPPPGSAEPAR